MPINKYLYGILALPGTISLVLKNIHVQKKFLAQYIDPILKNTLAANDGSIDDHDIRKINALIMALQFRQYWGKHFAYWGTNMTARERLASTAQGAMTGLFDDFSIKITYLIMRLKILFTNKAIPGIKRPTRFI